MQWFCCLLVGAGAAWPPGLGSRLHFLARKAWWRQACSHCTSRSSGCLRLATWGQAGVQEGGWAPWLSTMAGRTGRPQSPAPKEGVPAEKLQADGQTHQQQQGVCSYLCARSPPPRPGHRGDHPPRWLDPFRSATMRTKSSLAGEPSPCCLEGHCSRGAGFTMCPGLRFLVQEMGVLTNRLPGV